VWEKIKFFVKDVSWEEKTLILKSFKIKIKVIINLTIWFIIFTVIIVIWVDEHPMYFQNKLVHTNNKENVKSLW